MYLIDSKDTLYQFRILDDDPPLQKLRKFNASISGWFDRDFDIFRDHQMIAFMSKITSGFETRRLRKNRIKFLKPENQVFSCHCLIFSDFTPRLFVSHKTKKVVSFDLRNDKKRFQIVLEHSNFLNSLELIRNDQLLLVASADTFISLIEVDTRRTKFRLLNFPEFIYVIRKSRDDSHLFVGGYNTSFVGCFDLSQIGFDNN